MHFFLNVILLSAVLKNAVSLWYFKLLLGLKFVTHFLHLSKSLSRSSKTWLKNIITVISCSLQLKYIFSKKLFFCERMLQFPGHN